jgi:hypothetical protein
MSNKNQVEFPSKGAWRAMKEVKNSDIRHLKVTVGDDMTVIDSPTAFNLRMIPKVFTTPLQAVGLVTSIFARMTRTKISLDIKNDNE